MSPQTQALIEAQKQTVHALRHWHVKDEEDLTVFEGFSLAKLCLLDLGLAAVRLFHRAALGFDPDGADFFADGTEEKYGPVPEISLDWRRTDGKARAFRRFHRLARAGRRPAPAKSALVIGASSNRVLWRYWLKHRDELALRLDFSLRNPPGLLNGVKAALAGARLFDPEPAPLTSAQARRVAAIRAALDDYRRTPPFRALFAREGKDLSGLFCRDALVPFSAKLEGLAVKCLAFERAFLANKPDLLLIPEDASSDMRLLSALARKHGVPVWYLAHGFLGGGYTFDEMITCGELDADRVLAWGPVDRENFLRAGVPEERIEVVGFPAFDPFFPLPAPRPLKTVRGATLLALAYVRPMDTTRYVDDGEERFFLETARVADRLGAAELLVKLHPGRARMDFYGRLATRLNLKCGLKFLQDEPFLNVLDRADAVIGPISTAVFETILKGKDYFLVQPDPNDIPPPFELKNAFVAKDYDELERNLAQPRPVPRETVLRDFCGISGSEQPWHFTRRLLEKMAAAPKIG